MKIKQISDQGLTHPFGDERTVKQAFPSGVPSDLSDPFLMCDYFGSKESTGKARHEDDFPVDWHPHRGFDICSYLKSGTGRHGDSLGNRETYDTPGMQWMSTGSGVEHAEGGANERGVFVQGFQIWINVPGERKMDDPRYGTVPTKDLPLVAVSEGVTARVLAGRNLGKVGPFETVQPVEMIDIELEPNAIAELTIGKGLDTCMIYVYEGSLSDLNESSNALGAGKIVLMNADSDDKRGIQLIASSSPAKALLFAGKKLKEPIAWHGPIVMNTREEIQATFQELRSGRFPPKRVDWDYKHLSEFPSNSNKSEL